MRNVGASLFRTENKFQIGMTVTVLLFYYCTLLLSSRSLLRDPDTLWHIRTGQWILDQASFPVVDSYSYTAAGQRWISVEWLSDIVFSLAYRIAEWAGVVVLSTTLCAAIIATLCWYLLRNLRFSVAIAWTAVTALAISPHFLARPHLFSYLLMLFWLATLLDNYDKPDFKPTTLLLCAIIVLWANLHGSFTFGLALLGIFIGYSCCEKISQRDYSACRRNLITAIFVGFCALATPYGIYSALLTLETSSLAYALQHIQEWHSPNFQQQRVHLVLMVGLLVTLVGLGVRVRGPRLIVFGMILLLGLSHARGLLIFFLLVPVILARPLSECLPWFRPTHADLSQDPQAANADPVSLYLRRRSVAISLVFLTSAVVVTAASWRRINVGPPETVAPKEAIDFVRRAGITGNVFNSYNFGGYLIFLKIPTFIDGRIPPYSDEFVRRVGQAVNLADINDSFRLLDEYKVNWVLLRPVEPMTKALARSGSWNQVYSDEYAVVFVRRE
jgi:hypothetical protein